MASVHGSAPSGGAQELLDPAWQMRWRVPELALVLSDRVVAQARATGDRPLRLRAEALALFASNRLGRGVSATHRAIAAFRDAESSADPGLVAQIRVELACCARDASSHEVALRVLSPVLDRERIDPVVRAHALLELAAVLPLHRKESEGAEALDEADRLYLASDVNRETGRLLRARVATARSAHHRRNGDFTSAVRAADDGLALLAGLGDPGADSGEISANLVLERVHGLLELGDRGEAVQAARPIIGQPVRAAAAGPSGWLRLALATRVHLPEGEHGVAICLLNDAAADAERYKLDCLRTETLSTTSQAYERAEDVVAALRSLRGAYAAERRWRVAVHSARLRLLEQFPAVSGGVTVSRSESFSAEVPAPAGGPDSREVAAAQEGKIAREHAASREVPASREAPASREHAASREVPASPGGADSPGTPAPREPEPSRARRRRSDDRGSTDTADAARRLLEKLTGRAAEQGPGEQGWAEQAASSSPSGRRAMPEPRIPDPEQPERSYSEHGSAGGTSPGNAVGSFPMSGFSADPPASEPVDEADLRSEGLRSEGLHGADWHAADRHAADRHSADRHGAGQYKADQYGADRYGADRYGADRYGEGRHSPDWSRTDWLSADPSSADRHGTDRHSTDRHSADRHGADLPGGMPTSYESTPSQASASSRPGSHASPDPQSSSGVESDYARGQERDTGPVVKPEVPLDTWGAWGQSPSPQASEEPAARPEPPDVTTIMPVIAVPPEEPPAAPPEPSRESPRRHREPESEATSSRWSDGDSPSADRSLEFPFSSSQRAESQLPARETQLPARETQLPERESPARDWDGPSWDAPSSEPAAHEPPVFEPSPRETPAYEPLAAEFGDEPAPPDERSDPSHEGGRRSKGRSLAEIRASLRLVQDSGRWGVSAQAAPESSAGRRHARHADPDDEPEHSPGAEPAGELLARHGQWLQDPPSAEQQPAAEARPEPDPEPPAEVGLADLLAEALMAYENGRRDQPESEARTADTESGGRRRAGSNVPGVAGHSHTQHSHMSTSDPDVGAARHRAGLDPGGFTPRSWNSYGP